ncbi:MAG: potassium-transporting ATPase subunit KdpB [bacterium]
MKKIMISNWDAAVVKIAAVQAFTKLNPFTLWRNPVMFIVEIGSVIISINYVQELAKGGNWLFTLQIALWLWFTVIFANFAEALAEGQGKAQADSLKKTRSMVTANRLTSSGTVEAVPSADLRKEDHVIVKEGEVIPSDGDVIKGAALVDESAITGESAPVVRESGSDHCGVTGGTTIITGTVTIRVSANPGETFLDQMISMVEGAKRHKTPNEIALEIFLVALTALFLVVVATLPAFSNYMQVTVSLVALISLLVCLMPTTIGGLLPAIGIAGMDRLLQRNVIALSGRAIEAAGDVNVVLTDKTGTITIGNRQASEFLPAPGVTLKTLAKASLLSSLPDETPEGKSIVALAKEILGTEAEHIHEAKNAVFVPFTPETRMSGVDIGTTSIRKGAPDTMEQYDKEREGTYPEQVRQDVDTVARSGGTPLVVIENNKVLGTIRLKDILKKGIRERLLQLHGLGIRSVMITGDNPLTAAAIAAEAGIDDFVAQAKPESKLELIKKYQREGHMVAMIGDGTNDAPALAQSDVAVAMNSGTQAAKEASNMVDLDSDPSKLLDIVEIGKNILITRGALTTFSVANDVAKYFAIIPAIFAAQYPQLNILNIMQLATPQSAILSAIIFNALVIPFLIPLALRGVKFKVDSPTKILQHNLLVYGAGGLLLPFLAIKALDIVVVLFHLA